jgi:hypothetical protein
LNGPTKISVFFNFQNNLKVQNKNISPPPPPASRPLANFGCNKQSTIMLTRLTTFFVAALLLFSCGKTDPPIVENPPIPFWDTLPDNGTVRFDALQVGQRSHYLRFEHNDQSWSDFSFTYQPDTLWLLVKSKTANQFTVNELLQSDTAVGGWLVNSEYQLEVRNDSLFYHWTGTLAPPSLFGLQSSNLAFGLPLAVLTQPTTTLTGWRPDIAGPDTYTAACLVTHTQLGSTYDHLNAVADGRDQTTDGFGYVYLYSATSGLVRFAYFNSHGAWPNPKRYCWDKVD